MTRTVSNSTQRPVKAKVDFTISSNSDDEEDGEWVSSSSGPVTPSNLSSDEEDSLSPVEPPTPVENSRFAQAALNGNVNETVSTPRAGIPPATFLSPHAELSATPPARSPPIAQVPAETRPPKTEQPSRVRDHNIVEVQTMPKKQPPVKQVRSEASSPPSPPQYRSNRQSSTRPPSLYSINTKSEAALRPHPLIRGQSFGVGTPTSAKPAPLAPLTTMPAKDTAGFGYLSSSPPILSPGLSHRSVSPARSLKASLTTHGEYPSEARTQLRRQSTSSQVSTVAAISRPSTPTTTTARVSHDRQRTMSTLSTSSSLSALTSLHPQLHGKQPARSSISGYTSQFPPLEESGETSETIHMLLPPPYLTAHWTVLAHRSPIRESYDRVVRAKRQQR